MSPNLQHLDVPQEDLDLRNRARIGAVALLVILVSALVVIAPDAGNPFTEGSHLASAPGHGNAAAAD